MTAPKHTFICIGAQKAGTTTLADILSLHPDIYIPEIKETKYFLFEEDYAKGIEFYNKTYFSTYKGQTACGEFDPDYMLFPFTAKRISDTLGTDIKIIVVLRNPADRAYSHYLMTRKKGLEKHDFLRAIEMEPQRRSGIKETKIYAYIERGYYGRQISEFLKYFSRENFLFLVFEDDIIRNREATFKTVQEFIGVSFHKLDTNIHSNEAGEFKSEAVTNLVRKPNFAKRVLKMIIPSGSVRKSVRKYFIKQNMKPVKTSKLDEATRKMLIEKYFAEDIALTRQITGRDLNNWL